MFTPNTLSLPREGILTVAENKVQMNKMLYSSLLEPEFLKLTETFEHKLTLVGVEDHPIEIYKGTVIRRRDIVSKHEEADLGVAQHAILSSLENQNVTAVTDDTDIFALLIHFYHKHNCTASMYMTSPKNHGKRKTTTTHPLPDNRLIDIKASVAKHHSLCPFILQIHGPTGNDTTAALLGYGKKKILNAVNDGKFDLNVLSPIGDLNSDTSAVASAATKMFLATLGKQYIKCKSMTEARIKMWKQKAKKGPVKLKNLAPTTEAAAENFKRGHLQVAIWNSAVTGEPPNVNETEYGYHEKMTAKGPVLVPNLLPPGVEDTPPFVRSMISCNCEKSECKGTHCSCSAIGCTIFCKCEAGSICKNPLTKRNPDDGNVNEFESDHD